MKGPTLANMSNAEISFLSFIWSVSHWDIRYILANPELIISYAVRRTCYMKNFLFNDGMADVADDAIKIEAKQVMRTAGRLWKIVQPKVRTKGDMWHFHRRAEKISSRRRDRFMPAARFLTKKEGDNA